MVSKLRWVDNLRTLATFCVILIHVSAPLVGSYKQMFLSSWWSGNIINGGARFAVPIFFMIIGAIQLGKEYKLLDYLKRRAKRILPPFMFWTFIYVLFDSFVLNNQSKHGLLFDFKSGLFYGIRHHVWFIYVLIEAYLIIPILSKWCKYSNRQELLYFLIIWSITIFYAIPYFSNDLPKFHFDNFAGYAGFMVLGYYLNQLGEVKNKWSVLLIILGTFGNLYGTFYLTSSSREFSGVFYEYLTFNVLLQSIGVFLLVKNTVIKGNLMNQLITFISDHSFGIYLVHILVLEVLGLIGVDYLFTLPLLAVLLTSLSCLIISGGIVFLLRKIRWLTFVIG